VPAKLVCYAERRLYRLYRYRYRVRFLENFAFLVINYGIIFYIFFTYKDHTPVACAVYQREEVMSPDSRLDQRKGASAKHQKRQEMSSDTCKEAERVYHTIKDEDLPPSLRDAGQQETKPKELEAQAPQPPPVRQGSSRGRVSHGNGSPDVLQGDGETSSDTVEGDEAARRYATYTYTSAGS